MSEGLTLEQLEDLADEITKSEFPFSKVKKIVKLDPAISIVTPEAVKMLTKAAEMYMIELGKACYTQAVIDKRKTVQKKDINDLLDDWPEIAVKTRNKDNNAIETVQEFDEVNEEAEASDLIEMAEEIENLK